MKKLPKLESDKKQSETINVTLKQLRAINVKLTTDDLMRGIPSAKLKTGAVYQFTYRDLCLASPDGPPYEPLEGDLVTSHKDDDDHDDDEVVCPCVYIVIIAKSPTKDGSGQDNSTWENGGWNDKNRRMPVKRNKDAFQKLIKDALTLAGFPEYCINVKEVDLSNNKKWDKYFAKDADGEVTEALDYEAVYDPGQNLNMPADLRSEIGQATARCFTVVFVKFIQKGGAGFGPRWAGGMTPFEPTPQPAPPGGPRPTTFKLKSFNISFAPDSLESWAIAHEMFHQGGCTHSDDNLLYPDNNGQPDPGLIPPAHKRPPADLLSPNADGKSKPVPADLTKLLDYAKGNKCCDVTNKPDGSCVKKVL